MGDWLHHAWRFFKASIRIVTARNSLLSWVATLVGLTAAGLLGWLLGGSSHLTTIHQNGIVTRVIHKSPHWPFALAAVCLALAVDFFATGVRIHREGTYDADWTKIPVVSEVFRNQEVVLDGHSFSNCQFYNVTFVVNGTKPFDVVGCDIHGAWFRFNSPQAHDAIGFLTSLGFLSMSSSLPLPPPPPEGAPPDATTQP